MRTEGVLFNGVRRRKGLYSLSLVTGRDLQWLSSQLRTEGPRPRLTPSPVLNPPSADCAQLTPSSEHKQSAAPTPSQLPHWQLMEPARPRREVPRHWTQSWPLIGCWSGNRPVIGQIHAGSVRGMYNSLFNKIFESLSIVCKTIFSGNTNKIQISPTNNEYYEVSFYKIITHTHKTDYAPCWTIWLVFWS